MKVIKFIFIIIFLFSINHISLNFEAFAYTTLPQKNQDIDSTKIALENQIKIMKDYNDSILSTVYWSLGICLAIGILLVGYGWFVNFRIYERDKNILKQEIKNYIKIQFLEIQNKINEDLKTKEKIIEDNLINKIRDVNRELNIIKYELEGEKAKKWIPKIYSNALHHYSEMLRIGIDLNNRYYIQETLDNIMEALNSKQKFDIEAMQSVLDSISNIPIKYQTHAESIKNLIKNIQTNQNKALTKKTT